jgi:hypothetical protein
MTTLDFDALLRPSATTDPNEPAATGGDMVRDGLPSGACAACTAPARQMAKTDAQARETAAEIDMGIPFWRL